MRAANARLRQVVEAKDTEIAALRTSHQAQLDALRAQVAALSAEVAELRVRLRQNLRNSSRPPSSEGLAKPAPRSLRKKSGHKPGRPKGQPGATLEMTGRPDEVVTHEPGRSTGCGAGLRDCLARRSRGPGAAR
jgi:transposase